MYLNTTIKIPEIKGKIITKKKGTTTYILYQYGSEYRPEKQYSVPLRTIVGKISSSDSTLMSKGQTTRLSLKPFLVHT
jgi:hypothetical protein